MEWGFWFARRHLELARRHLAFAIRLFPIPYSKIRMPQFPERVQRPLQLPGLGRLVTPEPLEPRA
ncbi:MAG TPA: hypothetical protein VJY33_10985, partial [Isosphaeraceae bacterium]|nr:hypothetical protein [Isosphaeraceae bacterium]